MNLHALLQRRAAAGKPVRVGLIGGGKFGTMFLAQARHVPGLHVLGIADLKPERVRASLGQAHWPAEAFAAKSLADALKTGGTHVGDDALALIKADGLDVLIEATGYPPAGIKHALAAFKHKRHVVMVTVEADVLAGPLLAKRAEEAGVVYSLAYGDQPAEICELVDWARACGFGVQAAGRGVKYLPRFHQSTPDTVWADWGMSPEEAKKSGMNAQMFNSFNDGSKPAIELGAVSNATGLMPPDDGLGFEPCGVDDLPHICRPVAEGGRLSGKGMVVVVSSLERDGRPVYRDIRPGVFVVIEAPGAYTARSFRDYHMLTDASGRYTALYRPYHMIGLEVGISVLSVALRGEPTGCPIGWHADAVATAKKDLKPGDVLDGEGGYCAWGKLIPARRSREIGALPLGLAHHLKVEKPVKQGEILRWSDVSAAGVDGLMQEAIAFRRQMEQDFAPAVARAAE
ncbi:MAG: flagellar biosynthesis protein FlgA [Alphaproteobacteria bacterium]|nr:flagellar biosynthesis protein FlgA [Alphaproteobacteria bacterium]